MRIWLSISCFSRNSKDATRKKMAGSKEESAEPVSSSVLAHIHPTQAPDWAEK